MKLFHTDLFVLPLPDGHRFPMARYRLLRERLEASRLFPSSDICIPAAATDEQLLTVHTQEWIRRVADGSLTSDELRRIGFPWSLQMVERCRRSTGATVAASGCALQDGVAANLAGGTHHAFPDRGAGYCVFNDVAVAARVMQSEGLVRRVLVADGDVHQGDGTAFIFQHDESVRTFSLHAAKAFPARKMVSDVDIELPPGADDAVYLEAWQRGLEIAANGFDPDLVYFVAGADPFAGDTLGGLAVSKQGLAMRDQILFEMCRSRRWPVVIVMAGGYAAQISDIVDIQFETITASRRMLGP
jgi:acetoin utilization deacetylase AcuC-like enzyme